MTHACPDCIGETLIRPPSPPYGLLLCARHREARAGQGCMWVTKGMGNTGGELLDAIPEHDWLPSFDVSLKNADFDLDLKTELLLTGNPLSKRDYGRIADAIQWARTAAHPPAWPVRGKA